MPQPQSRVPLDKPDWTALSREGRRAVGRAHASERPFREALQEEVAANPRNPFIWHAAAVHETRILRSKADAHRVLDAAMEAVPRGRRAALFLVRAEVTPDCAAVAVLRDGIDDDPGHAPLYWALANVRARLGDLEAARLVFREGEESVPNMHRGQVVRSWAVFEYNYGFPELSRDLWRRAVEIDPSDPKAWRRHAEAEENAGAGQRASLAILQRALAQHPTNSELRICVARMEERVNGAGSSRKYLEDPCMTDDADTQRALAILEVREKNFERARLLFRHAADLEAVYLRRALGTVSGSSDEVSVASNGNVFRDGLRPRQRGRRGPRTNQGPTAKSLHAWALMEVKCDDLDGARKLLEEAQTLVPEDAAIWRALAEIESRERNFEAARRAFRRSVAIDGADVRLWLAWGRTESLAGNFREAEKLLSTAVEQFQFHKGPPHTRARSCRDSPDDDLGEGVVSSLPAVQSRTFAEALKELAVVALQVGNLEKALGLLERATATDPTYDQAWRALAEHVLRLSGIDAVRSVYERALKVSHRNTHARLLHWWALDERQAKCFSECRVLLERATTLEPEYMSAWLSWALLEKSEGMADRACHLFSKAAERATRSFVRSPFLFQAWGRVEELNRGDPDKARHVFKRGFQLTPESGMLLQGWAQLEERCGQINVARELFAKAVELEPQNGLIWQSWGMLEVHRRNYDRAATLFQCGVEKDRGNAALLSSWAMMEGRLRGHVELGRELFARATAADPLYALAWHSWGSLEAARGNVDRARQLYIRAAELGPDDPVSWHALGMLEAEHSSSLQVPMSYFRKAIKADPKHAMSYQTMALFTERKANNVVGARRYFQEGVKTCRTDQQAILYQAWAVMEQRKGDIARARELLQKGLEVRRQNPELWSTYALLEKSVGNRKAARRLFREGCAVSVPVLKVACLYASWGTMEAELGNWGEARQLFRAGIRIDPGHEPCWLAFASMEDKLGNAERASELRTLFETNGAVEGFCGDADVEDSKAAVLGRYVFLPTFPCI
jgi:tetratricopeptide (TPR) repeat protein